MNNEKTVHRAVCDYIKYQYPSVLFNTDMSGIRLTKGQAANAKQLRSNNGFPDIVIYKPKTVTVLEKKELKFALFLELKREGEKIFKMNAEPKNEHISNQIKVIKKLNSLGYYAVFCIGFDEAKNVIDWYLT